MFDHVAVGAHAHLVAAVADGDGGGSRIFASGEKEGGVSDHVIEDFAAHAVVVAVGGFTRRSKEMRWVGAKVLMQFRMKSPVSVLGSIMRFCFGAR